MSLNGTNQRINIATNTVSGTNAPVTLSAWMKYTSSGSNLGVIGQYLGGDPGRFIFGASNGNIYFFIGGGTLSTLLTYDDGTWHYGTIVYDGFNLNLYADGLLKNTTAAGNIGAWPVTNTAIGDGDTGGDFPFPGSVDEAAFSKAARSSSWILTEYSNQAVPDDSDAGGFYHVGTEQTNGGGVKALPTSDVTFYLGITVDPMAVGGAGNVSTVTIP